MPMTDKEKTELAWRLTPPAARPMEPLYVASIVTYVELLVAKCEARQVEKALKSQSKFDAEYEGGR